MNSHEKKKPDEIQKSKQANYALQHVRTGSVYGGWRASWIFHERGPY